MKKKIFIVPVIALLLAIMIAISVGQKASAEQNAVQPSEKQAVSTFDAKSALLMDFNTMTVLYEQNSKQRLQIASMTKIMTLLIIYDEIAAGNISFDTEIAVSANAASMGGSQAFIDANTSYKAGELVKSIVVASANDSCVAMAEHISGDVTNFVSRMNEKSVELGLSDTNFANCTGLPAEQHYSSAYDVAIMSKHMMSNPMFFEHSKIWMYDFEHMGGRVTGLTNTNKLIRFYEGCDGGKTGFTKEALSCLSATAKRGDTRLISVIIGAPTAKIRNAEVSRMLNYGFANFETKQVVFKGIEIGEPIAVSQGKTKSVSVVPSEDFYILSKKGANSNHDIETQIQPLAAPVKAGDVVGKMSIKVGGELIGEVSLLSTTDVKKATYLDMIDKLVDNWN